MLDLVIRIIEALVCSPIVATGNIQYLNPYVPVGGNQPNSTEKISTSNIAIQKEGAETPKREIPVKMRSKIEYCLIEEIIPIGTPIKMPNATLPKVNVNVIGYRDIISSKTEILLR